MNTVPMNTLKIGEKAEIKSMNITGSMRQRLRDIGLIEGTLIECVLKSPKNDPVAYNIRGAIIALRNCDSKEIMICKI